MGLLWRVEFRLSSGERVNFNAVSAFLTFSPACVWEHVGRNSAQVSKREKITAEGSPWKLLLWTAIAGLVFGLIGFGEIAEDWLRVARNRLHWHHASGNIVLVKIDDQSLRDVGRWPWPRREVGQITNRLTAAGAKRIFFDLTFYDRTNATDDQMFADALRAFRLCR